MTEIIQADADRVTITERYAASCGCDRNITPKMGGEAECIRHGIQQYVPVRSAVIVMDGECHGHCGPHMDCTGTTATSMPEQVRRLTEPCQTCDGTTDVYCADDDVFPDFCTDCRDGKPTFTLHQRVIEPHKYTEKSARARLQRRRENDDELFMIEMDGDWYTGRFIDLGDGWVIRDVLPITERNDRSETRLVFLNEVGNAYLYDPTNTINVPLDMPSAARPGQYAIIAEQAGR